MGVLLQKSGKELFFLSPVVFLHRSRWFLFASYSCDPSGPGYLRGECGPPRIPGHMLNPAPVGPGVSPSSGPQRARASERRPQPLFLGGRMRLNEGPGPVPTPVRLRTNEKIRLLKHFQAVTEEQSQPRLRGLLPSTEPQVHLAPSPPSWPDSVLNPAAEVPRAPPPFFFLFSSPPLFELNGTLHSRLTVKFYIRKSFHGKHFSFLQVTPPDS